MISVKKIPGGRKTPFKCGLRLRRHRIRHPLGLNYNPRRRVFRRGHTENKKRSALSNDLALSKRSDSTYKRSVGLLVDQPLSQVMIHERFYSDSLCFLDASTHLNQRLIIRSDSFFCYQKCLKIFVFLNFEIQGSSISTSPRPKK